MAVVAGAAALTATLPAAPAHAKKRKVQCEKGYQVSEVKGPRLHATWTQRARNNGGSTDEFKLQVTRSGTVETKKSANIEGEVGGNWGVFSASLRTQVGIEATESTTATRGVEYTVKVPPRREVQVRYGVWTRSVKGMIVGDPMKPDESTVSPLPSGCTRRFLGYFTARVATKETGFVKSKPRRIDG
jgi:hypothetical protein